MSSSIEQLLKIQDVDSEVFLLTESRRMRPQEIKDEKRKVVETRALIEALTAQIKELRLESDRREVDVKKADAEVEKYNVALNQAKSNEEYNVFKEQIRRQEQIRGQAEEEVLEKLTRIDELREEEKLLQQKLAREEEALAKKSAAVEEIIRGIDQQLATLKGQREKLLDGINKDHFWIYERVLARHKNFAIARVENQVCQGCFMSITAQELNLLMQQEFVQCRSCSRILYLDS